MLGLLESLSRCGIVHGDIQPGNFLMGKDDDTHRRTVHLIDFGLSSTIASEATGSEVSHISALASAFSALPAAISHPIQGSSRPSMTVRPLASTVAASTASWATSGRASGSKISGTLDFSSSRVLRGLQAADPRDDLESLAYTLLYLLRGCLPWGAAVGAESEEKNRKASPSLSPLEARREGPNAAVHLEDPDLDLDLMRTAEATADAKDACFSASDCLVAVAGPADRGDGATAVAERFIRSVICRARGVGYQSSSGRGTSSSDGAASGAGVSSTVFDETAEATSLCCLPPLLHGDFAALRSDASDALAAIGVPEGADVVFDWEAEGISWSPIDGSLRLEGYR